MSAFDVVDGARSRHRNAGAFLGLAVSLRFTPSNERRVAVFMQSSYT
jgi:hypothetical protein